MISAPEDMRACRPCRPGCAGASSPNASSPRQRSPATARARPRNSCRRWSGAPISRAGSRGGPPVWADYLGGLADDLDAAEARTARLGDAIVGRGRGGARPASTASTPGRAELVATGYLHNHARMWFASIWVFTLDLPWRDGRGFLPAPPARRRPGFQHAGLALGGGAAHPRQGLCGAGIEHREIHRRAVPPLGPRSRAEPWPLEEAEARRPMRPPRPPDAAGGGHAQRAADPRRRLPGEDVLRDPAGVAAGGRPWPATRGRSPRPVAAAVRRFDRGALARCARPACGARRARGGVALEAATRPTLADWAAGHGAGQIVAAHAPTGPVRDRLDRAAPALGARGHPACRAAPGLGCAVLAACHRRFLQGQAEDPAGLLRTRPRGLTPSRGHEGASPGPDILWPHSRIH